MKYTQIPADTFEKVQLNAGVLTRTFEPTTGEVSSSSIVGATSGGVTFTAKPSYSDFGSDIDNCPTNTMELKKLDTWEIAMSGSFVTADAEVAKLLASAVDNDGDKLTPRVDVLEEDYTDIWWIGDYSDVNDGASAGFIAIHMMNVLNTGGFKLKSSNKGKGAFDFEFVAHYSIRDTKNVPFEIYVHKGSAE